MLVRKWGKEQCVLLWKVNWCRVYGKHSEGLKTLNKGELLSGVIVPLEGNPGRQIDAGTAMYTVLLFINGYDF